jgi:membrane fusion protein, heavy metal efflux system
MVGARIEREMALTRLREEISRAEAAMASEKSRLALAEREMERVSSLVEIQALPERRLEQARTEVEIVGASLQAAGRTLEFHRETLERFGTVADVGSLEDPIPVPAPIGGVVVESAAVEGRYVDGRQTLFRIVDSRELWLKGRIFERDFHRVRSFEGGTAELPGLESIPLAPGAIVTVGTVLDPAERTVPVVFRLRNPGNRIRLGSMGTLELEIGESRDVLAAPRSAVLLEENRSVVYVQLSGEEFERRLVRTGAEDRRWVEILDGLEEGDRVVTIGAYDVALAARSVDIADHGHVH